MRNYEQEFTDTCKLMRNYMEQNRPQSFASVWNLFQRQKTDCEHNDIQFLDISDIEQYAKDEHIEQYGFEK